MKKRIWIFLIIAVILAFMIGLTACNKQVFDFKLKFDYAYVKIGEEWKTVEVDKWNDYEGDQLQLVLKDGSVLVVHSVNCILYKGNLPD